MERPARHLTEPKIKNLIKRAGRYPDGAGLYLRVGKNLSASWVVRYSVDR